MGTPRWGHAGGGAPEVTAAHAVGALGAAPGPPQVSVELKEPTQRLPHIPRHSVTLARPSPSRHHLPKPFLSAGRNCGVCL